MNKSHYNININNVVLAKAKPQRYSNDSVFTKREHALLAHVRAPTVPKARASLLLHHKHSCHHHHRQRVYLTESNAIISHNCCKGHSRVLPQCKSEIDVVKAKYVHRYYQCEPTRNCINKMREVMLIRNSTDAKKERAVRLKRIYDNEINGLTDMMSSLNDSKVLFTETFSVKFNEHVKQLRQQTENEKRKLHLLIQAVMKCKHDIKHIEAQIKKIEVDKTNVLKWLCLQIKVKERKLALPSHYTTILEHKDVIAYAHNNNSNNSSSSSRHVIRNNTRKLNTLQQLIPLSEVERICKYKEQLIYHTADAFINQLHQIENDNIAQLETYNALLDELQTLRNERNEVCLQMKLHYTNTQHEVDVKANEVAKLKFKNAKLLQRIDELKFVSGSSCASTKRSFVLGINNSVKVDTTCTLKQSKLFTKVVDLYNTVLDVKGSNEYATTHYGVSRGNEMLMMLKYVELAVDALFGVFNYYNNNKELYHDRLRQIKNKIEMKHKLEHALHQKEVYKEKWKCLQEQIQQRNNKVYYQQYRKVNDYYKWLMKNNKRKTTSAVNVPQPSFHEFMYDIMDDNN